MLKSILRLLSLLVLLAGCAKQADLPDLTVSAASPGEFARFRADLGTRFPAEQLKDFDTATQELQLDAMNRDIPTAAGREADMLIVARGKTVRAVTLLGWQARKARFLREIADMTKMLENDLTLQAKTAATGTPEFVTRRLGSEREVLAKLQASLAATESRLAALGTAPH
ncbi:MAG: hypothetical protein HYX71_08345 [Opitutae bacterium]|nr:hypothetical protein [Opitutae bacterium]